MQLLGNTLQRRDDLRDQFFPNPRAEHPFRPMGCIGAQFLVSQADACGKRLRQFCNGRGFHRAGERARRKGGASFFFRQHHRALHRQLKPVRVVILEQSRRRLAAQPFQQPPLFIAGLFCQHGGTHWAKTLQGFVQSEPITQVDHQRHHLAHFVTPDGRGVTF